MPADQLDISLPLLFVEDLEAPVVEKADRHHFEKVLRVKYGDSINISDARGRWRRCIFDSSLKDMGEVHQQEISERPEIGVGFSPLKGGRSDFIVAKLTELGVDFLTPFFAERSVVRPSSEKIASQMQRWRKIAREAAMQCRRVRLPEIKEPVDFMELAQAAAKNKKDGAGKKTARCDRAGKQLNFSSEGQSLEFSHLLAGPEGGWTQEERQALAEEVCLGENVLRSETAAVLAGAFLAQLRQQAFKQPLG